MLLTPWKPEKKQQQNETTNTEFPVWVPASVGRFNFANWMIDLLILISHTFTLTSSRLKHSLLVSVSNHPPYGCLFRFFHTWTAKKICSQSIFVSGHILVDMKVRSSEGPTQRKGAIQRIKTSLSKTNMRWFGVCFLAEYFEAISSSCWVSYVLSCEERLDSVQVWKPS